MPSRHLLAALVLVLALPAVAAAAPADSKVGDVRVAYAKAGTALRTEPLATATLAGTVPVGGSVTVLEVKLPWIRVRSASPAVEGWLRAYETVEPTALAKSPTPPYVEGVGSGQVTAREVTAAG